LRTADAVIADPLGRNDEGSQAFGLVQNAMGSPVSRNWKGYWQRAA